MIRRVILALPLLLAACSHQSPAPAQGGSQFVIPNAANVSAEIQKSIPPGTPIATAQAYMQQHGFACTPTMGTSYNTLDCRGDEPLRPGMIRRWHVAIYYRGDKVVQLAVSSDLSTQVQAREASQPPTH